jgi:TolA-binding protein
MTPQRWTLGAVLLAVVLVAGVLAQQNRTQAPAKAPAKAATDIDLVERVLAARREYQMSLETLLAHYISVGDIERARWAEDELRQYHRLGKQAYRLDMDVPPPTIKPEYNVPEANELYRRAMTFKDKGWGTDFLDNQRRAELLFQQLLTSYPQSSKISDTAFQLGDIYEGKAYKQYRRAAAYYERCFQWNPNTHFEARLRAARLYDKALMDRSKARELYQEILNHETDPRWLDEAKKRLAELSTTR